MIDNHHIRSSSRMAGEVVRYHTWPTIRRQTNADHSYHVMRIYWAVFGSVPPAVSAYIIHHDAPEIVTGDLPHPVKKNNPRVASALTPVEEETLEDLIGHRRAAEVTSGPTQLERQRSKACDLLEMWEFAAVDVAMGNQMASPIIDNIREALSAMSLSPEDHTAVWHYAIAEIKDRWETAL